MNAIANAYINALLADAAYVDPIKGMSSQKIFDVLKKQMTEPQAQFIAKNFEVIATENKSDTSLVGSEIDHFSQPCKKYVSFAASTFNVTTHGRSA